MTKCEGISENFIRALILVLINVWLEVIVVTVLSRSPASFILHLYIHQSEWPSDVRQLSRLFNLIENIGTSFLVSLLSLVSQVRVIPTAMSLVLIYGELLLRISSRRFQCVFLTQPIPTRIREPNYSVNFVTNTSDLHSGECITYRAPENKELRIQVFFDFFRIDINLVVLKSSLTFQNYTAQSTDTIMGLVIRSIDWRL